MVAEGIIKMDLVDKTLGSFVTTAWNKCEAMFPDIRKKQPDPFLAECYQWLAAAIDDRMKKKSAKTISSNS
jgi:hypothetical protein